MLVLIERLDYFGRGIGYIDGKICFVENALEKELVNVKITKETKGYYEGKVINYIKKSPERVESLCPIYDRCGGCQLQHMNILKENEFKTLKVKDLLKRIGKIDPSIVRDCINVNEYNYRNKLTLHQLNNKIGLYKENSNEIVELSKCLITREELNEKIYNIKDIMLKCNNTNKSNKIVLRVGNNNHNVIIEALENTDNFKELNCYGLFVDNELKEGKYLISEIGEYKFYVSPESFFQVNGDMTKVLYDEVLKFCRDKKFLNVLDLYCGTGTIGIYISKYVDNVLGIDISKSSIDDANKNLSLNGVSNVKFICSRVEDYIDKIIGNYDLVIVDPPRAGLFPKTIDYLKKIEAKYIIYISCDPATLSRDLSLLKELYEIKVIKTFNMFPKTYHVESFCILEKISINCI